VTPPSTFGTFRVLHQIGSGVLGPVFRAYDSGRERLAAVKAFKIDLVPEDAARFAAELRRLTGPAADSSIVGVIDAGLAGSVPYLALEYATGDALDVVLREAGPPSVTEALALCRMVGTAIDASWARGIGHGSLHPRDVFVAPGGDEILVSGFGVAQALQVVGVKAPVRRPYAAPERVAGAEWGVTADVYALAAIARELLTDEGRTEPPRQFAAVLDRALSESPDARFATASEFVDKLESAASDEAPVTGMPTLARATRPAPEAPTPATTQGIRALDAPLFGTAPMEVDLPRHTPTPGVIAFVSAERPTFPWAAAIAIGLAGASVGAVAGYQMGFSRGSDRATALEIAHAARIGEEARGAMARDVQPPDPPPPIAETRSGSPQAPASSSRTLAAQVRPGAGSANQAANGAIEIDTLPRGARVTVDGRFRGETPLKVLLPPGEHRVRLDLAGHRPMTSFVSVQGGLTTAHKIRLEQNVPEFEDRTGKNR
jgi:hypothetical protein